jgi:hypothetical protein
MSFDVVTVYRVDGHITRQIVATNSCQLFTNVFDERAVITDKHDKKRAGVVAQLIIFSIKIRQREFRGIGTQFEHL